jgi:hypothetical protein
MLGSIGVVIPQETMAIKDLLRSSLGCFMPLQWDFDCGGT